MFGLCQLSEVFLGKRSACLTAANMAEDLPEDFYDMSLKKKKKKKKGMPDFLDEDDEGAAVEQTPAAAVEAQPAAAEDEGTAELDEEDFSLTLKKKKKKKKAADAFNFDDEPKSFSARATPQPEELDEAAEDAVDDMDASGELDFAKKKKKKAKRKEEKVTFSDDEEEGDEGARGATSVADPDKDYTYDELLDRVFRIMMSKNPNLEQGGTSRLVIRPPQVERLGTRRSAFVNFSTICKQLHRQPEHLMNFILSELGATGSVDGDNKLVIKGRFQQKQIESVLKAYIREYVTCHTCRSPNTILTKENRLFFLQCESCGAQCSVAAIHSGFQALTGKRAKIRAAAQK